MAAKICQVGATGFCQGGVLSFIAAQHAGINAAAPFYGFPQAKHDHMPAGRVQDDASCTCLLA